MDNVRFNRKLSFKAGDLLVLDETYLKDSGATNLAWLVLRTTPKGFCFIDLYLFLEGIQWSSAEEWHPAWRVIPGDSIPEKTLLSIASE